MTFTNAWIYYYIREDTGKEEGSSDGETEGGSSDGETEGEALDYESI